MTHVSDPRMRALYLVPLALAPVVVACPPREDITPQIEVSPNAAGRAALIPSRRGGLARPRSTARATARPLARGEELGGPNATGRAGDWVLANGEVVFVIDQLGSSSGFAETGGNIVDAADARLRRDELGQVFTYFGAFPRQALYERLKATENPDGSAQLEAWGKELREADLAVHTIYRLAPEDRAVLVTTTLTNAGKGKIEKLGLGDAIQWGGAEKTSPGKLRSFKGKSKGPYLGGVGRHVSYAVTSTDGEIEAVSGASWSDTIQRKDVALAPGESVQYARVFLVGERGDGAAIVAELTKAAGGAVGGIEIKLADAQGKAVSVPGARVVFSAPGGPPILDAVATKEGFTAELPPGTYDVAFAPSAGRRPTSGKVAVEVRPNGLTHASFSVSEPGGLWMKCESASKEPLPCRATLEGVLGASDPDLGPPHAGAFARNHVTMEAGFAEVPLAPGRYRVTLSRGPEYALAQYEEDVLPGESRGRASTLARVVDTAGYVATDFHQHTMLGADAPVALVDRVASNATEGVEIAVSTEHNTIVDLSRIVADLGLGRHLVHLAGNELTTDASRKPWGHANAFPLEVDATKPRGGAPAVRDRTAKEVFDEVRRARTGAPLVLQINHPRAGVTGYFDQLDFEPEKGVGAEPGYDPDFDALEVWNGRPVDKREKVILDLHALLRTGHPTTPTADTDTHGIVGQESGYPRTFVRVGDDTRLDAWSEARTADLVAGVRERRDVVLSNGPFLRVTAAGVGIGGLARGKRVEVLVHVEAAPWVDVREVEIQVVEAGRKDVVKIGPVQVKLAPTPAGAAAADVKVPIAVERDAAFVVIARGGAPMTPVLAGDPAEITPFAMTGAVWIDADGDGRSLGRVAPTGPVRVR